MDRLEEVRCGNLLLPVEKDLEGGLRPSDEEDREGALRSDKSEMDFQ